MISVIRIYQLYLQTVLITAGPSITIYTQVGNMSTVNVIFCSSKGIYLEI